MATSYIHADVMAANELLQKGYALLQCETQPNLYQQAFSFLNRLKEVDPKITKYLARKLSNGDLNKLHPDDKREYLEQGVNDGLIQRNGPKDMHATSGDTKTLFHFRKNYFDKLSKRVRNGEVRKILKQEWFRDGIAAQEQITSFTLIQINNVIKKLDELLPEHKLIEKYIDPRATNKHVLRILRYGISENREKILAKGHADRSLITAAICNTEPGLADENGNLLNIKENSILLFFGKHAQLATGGKWIQNDQKKWIIEGGLLQPFKHQVLLPDGMTETTRNSLVFFAKANVPYHP